MNKSHLIKKGYVFIFLIWFAPILLSLFLPKVFSFSLFFNSSIFALTLVIILVIKNKRESGLAKSILSLIALFVFLLFAIENFSIITSTLLVSEKPFPAGIKYNFENSVSKEVSQKSDITLLPGSSIDDCEILIDSETKKIFLTNEVKKTIASISFLESEYDFNDLIRFNSDFGYYTSDIKISYEKNRYLITLMKDRVLFLFEAINENQNEIYCAGNHAETESLSRNHPISLDATLIKKININEMALIRPEYNQNSNILNSDEHFIFENHFAFFKNGQYMIGGTINFRAQELLVFFDDDKTIKIIKQLDDSYISTSFIDDKNERYLLIREGSHLISLLKGDTNLFTYAINEDYGYIRSLKGVSLEVEGKKLFAIFAKLRATSHSSLLLVLNESGELIYEEKFDDSEIAQDYQYITKTSENEFKVSIFDEGHQISYLYNIKSKE